MDYEIMLGSTSDRDKLFSQLQGAAKDYKIPINVHYASADNTPDKVEKLGTKLASDGSITSGAGMSNVLSGVLKTYTHPRTLNIGLPITDSSTNGLSSLLSTSEKPPGNPVFTVGLNNSYAAITIAKRNYDKKFNKIKINNSKHRDFSLETDCIDKIAEQLDHYGITYSITSRIGKNDIVINPFRHSNTYSGNSYPCDDLRVIDEKLKDGNGIQIGVREKVHMIRWDLYINCLNDMDATGIVGIGAYKNAAIVVAQLLGDENAIQMIVDEKLKKKNTLTNTKSELITDIETIEFDWEATK